MNRDWKDNEIAYCSNLVRTGGNTSVPKAHVLDYLKLQHACASQGAEKDEEAANELQVLIDRWVKVICAHVWDCKILMDHFWRQCSKCGERREGWS